MVGDVEMTHGPIFFIPERLSEPIPSSHCLRGTSKGL